MVVGCVYLFTSAGTTEIHAECFSTILAFLVMAKGNISSSDICYLYRFSLAELYIGRPMKILVMLVVYLESLHSIVLVRWFSKYTEGSSRIYFTVFF